MCEFCSKELQSEFNEDFCDVKSDLLNSTRNISVRLSNPNPGTLAIAVNMFRIAKQYNYSGVPSTETIAKQNFRFSMRYCPFCGRKLIK